MSIGGVAAAGFSGDYYSTADLSGSVIFSRKEVRLSFAIPNGHKPGGSASPGHADVSANGWSARWTGILKSRVSETITFSATVSGKFRLYGRVVGAGSYDTLIDSWTASSIRTLTADVAFTAGTGYEVKVEYAGNDGQKDLSLGWSCPSDPTVRVIGPMFRIGDHMMKTELWANLIQSGRGWTGSHDANFVWNGDASWVIQESLGISPLTLDPFTEGTVNYKFTGQITSIGGSGNIGNFSAVAYDSGTNTTTGTFEIIDNNQNATFLNFYGCTNVSNIQVMRPGQAIGSVFDTRLTSKLTMAYSILRNQVINSVETVWADRTKPAFPYQIYGKSTTSAIAYYNGETVTTDNGPAIERLIQFANETGRDLQISVPPFANDDYITKLAQAIHYGTDGTTPYTSHQTNPVWPPLNSNLMFRIEIANELWNTAAGYILAWWAITHQSEAAYNGATTLGVTLNADYYSRRHEWIIARTMQISELFKLVVGSAHGSRYRFYFGFQYGNYNNTASIALNYATKLLEAGGLPSINIPAKPLTQYAIDAGGATYYGATDPDGVTDLIADPNGQTPTVSSGFSVRPGGATNTYAGPAGIVHSGSMAIAPEGGRTQCMFVAEGGRITMPFTVPANQTSDRYAVAVRAVNRINGGTIRFNIYLDYGTPQQQDLFAGSYSQLGGWYTPPYKISDWYAVVVSWAISGYYPSKSVSQTAGSSHTITILAEGTAGSDTIDANRPVIYLDEIRVASADDLANGLGLSSGQANGQPAASDVSVTLKDIVRHTAPHGLPYVAYEGGVGLGGDTHGNDLQNYFKAYDQRMKTAQKDAHVRSQQIGLAEQIFGTYAQQPVWDTTFGVQGWDGWENFPIPAGMVEDVSNLPAATIFEFTAPCTLKASDRSTTDDTNGGFFAWVVNVQTAGTYLITGSNLGTGRLIVDGVDLSGGQAFLTLGIHGIVLRAGSGATPSSTASIAIKKASVPTTSTAISAVAGQTVSWSADANATSGYVVRWGDETGRWYNRKVVAAGSTSTTITDLAQGTFLRMVVASANANGEGIPGTEKVVTRYQSGIRRVATWYTGSDRASLPTLPSIQVDDSGVTVGNLVSDFTDDGNYGVFGAHVTGVMGSNVAAAADHAAAYAGGHKFRFTVTTPAAGFAPSQFLFSALAHVPAGDVTARVWVDGVAAYTSGGMVSNRNDIVADLTGQGTWPGGVQKTIEITIAPLGGFYTAGIGHAPNLPAGLSFTGSVPSGFVPRRLLAAAGMMG